MEVKTETQLSPREVHCEVDEYIRGTAASEPKHTLKNTSLQNVPKLL